MKAELKAAEIIKNIPKAIISWYPFKTDGRSLFVGNKKDVLIDVLTDGGNKPDIVDPDDILSLDNKGMYDYVICTSVIEQYNNPGRILNAIKKTVRPDGNMLLIMNNRLAIRNFCGDRDVYTGHSFDGVENYRNDKRSENHPRCYSMSEIRKMLKEAGWGKVKFYSVFPGTSYPQMLFSEDYIPNEELSRRLSPMYNYPKSVFMLEEYLYTDLIENNMFHQMANGYLIECCIKDEPVNVSQVTSSLDRGDENGTITVIYGKEKVIKKPAWSGETGIRHIENLKENNDYLKAHGINVVEGELINDEYVMPYIDAENMQKRMQEILINDKKAFFEEMDRYFAILAKSSDSFMKGGKKYLKRCYMDMGFINCFFKDGQYLFFDQEYYVEDEPLDFMKFRTILGFFVLDENLWKYIHPDDVYKYYGLYDDFDMWLKKEISFIDAIRNDTLLFEYKGSFSRTEKPAENRERMNYGEGEYLQIFHHVFDNLEGRNLVLFGTGKFAEIFVNNFGDKYRIFAVIDNNSEKQGALFHGIKISKPDIMTEMDPDSYKVIICVKKYEDIIRQLEGIGVQNFSVFNPSNVYIKYECNI